MAAHACFAGYWFEMNQIGGSTYHVPRQGAQ